ncbi:hypothetical protein EYF80_041355 [Liparis tanakae]|uniref:Uncharacterized protein n=1 Tax=Liparis tanakae TaxID=230148 RepID=A0A4Z2G4H1_9TELE|nr:hypothetical protein EYF80_041355 [Liparis tanakae]
MTTSCRAAADNSQDPKYTFNGHSDTAWGHDGQQHRQSKGQVTCTCNQIRVGAAGEPSETF